MSYAMTVAYPLEEGSEFDFEYFESKHIPLCASLYASHGFEGYVLRKNVGPGPGRGGQFHAVIDLLFASEAQLKAGITEAGKLVAADVPNYTNLRPAVSFADVKVTL